MIFGNIVYPNARLIGLCSKTGPESGKSHVAARIVEAIQAASVLSFATPVKRFAGHLTKELYGVNCWCLPKDHYVGGSDRTVRDWFVMVGHGLRMAAPNVWIDCMGHVLREVVESDSNTSIVIDDVRYSNEVEAIKRWGGTVICIEDTTSERPIDAGDIDFSQFTERWTIRNDKTTEGLDRELRRVLPALAIGE